MSDMVEQIRESGCDTAAVNHENLSEMMDHEAFYTENVARSDSARIGTLHFEERVVSVYASSVIENGPKTYDLKNKLRPDELRSWYEDLFPKILEREEVERSDEEEIKYYVDTEVMNPCIEGGTIQLNMGVVIRPERVQDFPRNGMVEEAKEAIKNETLRQLEDKYYND